MTMKMMKSQIPNKPDLWGELTPNFVPRCKRVIITDDYYPALNRDNATLEVQPIQRITPTGICGRQQRNGRRSHRPQHRIPHA